MLNKKIVLIFSFGLVVLFTKAQTLSPHGISSTGGFSSVGGSSLSSTTGEMTMVATFSSGSIVITQGLQQPEDFNVGVAPLPYLESGIKFGPNPSTGKVNLFFNSTVGMNLIISVFDLKGALLYELPTEKLENTNFISFDFSPLPSGAYILDCKVKNLKANEQSHFSTKFNLEK